MSEPKAGRCKKKSGQGKGGGQKAAAKTNLKSELPAQNPSLTTEVNCNTSKPSLLGDNTKKEINHLPNEASKTQTQANKQQATSKSENKQIKYKSSNIELSGSITIKATTEKAESKPICAGSREASIRNEKLEDSHNSKDVSCEHQTAQIADTAKIGTTQSINKKLEDRAVPTKQTSQGDVSGKSKAELRAERRALQEAQRAAKQGKKDAAIGVKLPSASSTSTATVDVKPISRVQSKPTLGTQNEKGAVIKPVTSQALTKSTPLKQVKLFGHLAAYERNISVIQATKDGIHPAVVRLGLQYAEGVVCGSNARCSALIYALLEVVNDFKTPESKDFSHALSSMHIEKSMKFLEKCRPASVGMKVVCKKIMEKISELPKDLPEEEAKKQSKEILNDILEDDIIKAHTAIVDLAKKKIADDDVILTYGCSYIVKEILIAAHKTAKFRVVVVDSRPKLEGKSMLRYLIEQGIECTYVLINAVAYVMQEVTKVFLGAHALMANGYVMSRVGSSQVALVAKAFNKPVLVCCETYKFSELVQTDSFVFNELGNPVDLVDTRGVENPLSDWQSMKSLNILNLYYDVTPPDLVTVIINDVHLVPCTSVPVLLRVKPYKKK